MSLRQHAWSLFTYLPQSSTFSLQYSSSIFLLLFSRVMRIDGLSIISLVLLWASYSVFSRSHTHVDWSEKDKDRDRSETSEVKIFNAMIFRLRTDWACNRSYTHLSIVFSFLEKSYRGEDQNIDEDRGEADEVKINSSLRFSSLLLSIQYADYIIELHRWV